MRIVDFRPYLGCLPKEAAEFSFQVVFGEGTSGEANDLGRLIDQYGQWSVAHDAIRAWGDETFSPANWQFSDSRVNVFADGAWALFRKETDALMFFIRWS